MSDARTGVLELTLGDSYIGSAYSPQVEVTDTPTGHEVAITYMSPEGITTETFDVEDGATGPQGPAGFSPTVTITDTPTGHTVTITDEDGPHRYDVPNYAQEEAARQDAWDALSGEVTDAISDAETATSAASTAATSATSAATSANTAAQAATTAAGSANTAASSANAAATAANSAATAAGTAADAATTAAGDATDAASAANTAAEAAQEAATEVAPEVAWLWGNQLTKQVEGELLTVGDAYSAPPMLVGIEGKSTQASTTGKNLFDKDNAPLGYYGNDGVFHSSGSGSSGYSWWSVRVSEGDIIRWADSTNNYLTGWNGGTFVQLSATRPTSPFTVPSGVDEVRGYTQNSTLSTCIVTKNNDNLTYEPYTGGKPSPSPDYPQEIESVDELALSFAGKNLLPNDRFCRTYYNAADGTAFNPSAAGGGTVTDNGDGTYTMTAPSDWAGASFYSDALPAGEYYLKASFAGSAIRVSVGYVDASTMKTVGTPYNLTSNETVTRHWTFQSSVIVYVSVSSSSAGTVTITQPQLELGSTATAYESYAGHTVPIDLQDHVLRSLPDGTKDTLSLTYLRPSTREGWAWYGAELVQGVGSVTYDGSESWNYEQTSLGYKNFYRSGPSNSSPDTRGSSILCTHGIGSTAYQVLPDQVLISITGKMNICFGDTLGMTTAADFKTWLASNNVTVDYTFTTPVTHDLGEIELPVLPAPACTVWADPTTGLTMEYVRDSNLVVQSLSAETAIAYASIATVDGPTATASHAVGTYLTMGGTLYKVTSAIAVGETIAAGTNVTATTVMAELIARTA